MTTTKKTTTAKKATSQKVSALDAAAQVLAENGMPMTTREMIEAMAQKKLWESPVGKTPAATLYSAILRAAWAELKFQPGPSRVYFNSTVTLPILPVNLLSPSEEAPLRPPA
jgi:hypothetical protein